MAPHVGITHDGRVLIVSVFSDNSRQVTIAEEFSEPYECQLDHVHGVFCGIDRGFLGKRRFRPTDYREEGVHVRVFHEVLELNLMHIKQLERRWQEAEAAYVKAGVHMDEIHRVLMRRTCR